MIRRLLALVGLAPLRDLDDFRAQRRHLKAVVDHLKAQNSHLVHAAVEQELAIADEHYTLQARLPNTADDPPPFGRMWERPDPRSGVGPITVIGEGE